MAPRSRTWRDEKPEFERPEPVYAIEIPRVSVSPGGGGQTVDTLRAPMATREMDPSERLALLQRELEERQIDALVLVSGSTLRYVTGQAFEAHERLLMLAVPRSGTPLAVVPRVEAQRWRDAMPDLERVFYWDDAEGPDVAAGRALSNLTTARKVAVEPLSLRYFEYAYLKRHIGQAEIVSAEPVVRALRQRKESSEVAALRQAVQIAEASLEAVLPHVRPGVREDEIARRLSGELLLRGGGGVSFGPIVLAGARSALPHGEPGDHEIRSGELLLVDFGTSHHGYHADITRTFVVGAEPDDLQCRVHRAVLAANEAGRRAARAGVTASEVHHLCQADLHGPQWEGWTKYRTGHGLGLDLHEPPSVMTGSQVVLEPGMVFTIEPGLYREGWGGVRIEDDVLVTEDGAETLTTSPRELRVLGA